MRLPLACLVPPLLCLAAATPAQAQPTEGLIDTERLHGMVVDNAYRLEGGNRARYVIIDTRPPDRYAEACIFSAVNIPAQAFVVASPPLPEDRASTLVLYGDEGDLQANAGLRVRLVQVGYTKVFVYSEPFSVWKERRLPVVQARRPRAGDPRGGGPCRQGTFATENHSSSYDVVFTNTSDADCDTVSAYCLCSVSFGAYRQSREIAVTGAFAAGSTGRIATIEVTGPASRDIDWSWCKLR